MEKNPLAANRPHKSRFFPFIVYSFWKKKNERKECSAKSDKYWNSNEFQFPRFNGYLNI